MGPMAMFDSIFDSERRRWGEVRRSSDRKTKIGGSSKIAWGVFEDVRRFFEDGRGVLRWWGVVLRRTPHLRSSGPEDRRHPIFDLRNRRTKDPPSAIFDLRARRSKSPPAIFDLRPRRIGRRSDGRRGVRLLRRILRRWGGFFEDRRGFFGLRGRRLSRRSPWVPRWSRGRCRSLGYSSRWKIGLKMQISGYVAERSW